MICRVKKKVQYFNEKNSINLDQDLNGLECMIEDNLMLMESVMGIEQLSLSANPEEASEDFDRLENDILPNEIREEEKGHFLKKFHFLIFSKGQGKKIILQ